MGYGYNLFFNSVNLTTILSSWQLWPSIQFGRSAQFLGGMKNKKLR